ncbi:hypothetical protein N7G274_005971 [Stereocaulon virgatum]|uniref:Rhodopsin domain-containing protein n=1 Tax=Stereocaulon virgatum TaxID=373712 RepID=A0ABR4A7W1_9LECA
MRFVARKIQRTRIELDDYLCVLALLFGLCLTGYTIHDITFGHLGSTNVSNYYGALEQQYKSQLVGQLLWVTSVTLVRASVISLYIRIFQTPAFRTRCYGVQTFNVAYCVAIILACCLICRPFSYNWDRTIRGTCGDQKSLDLAIAVLNLLLDVTTVGLPMPVLWRLQMATSKKVIVSGILSMGIIICIITLIRLKVTTEINSPDAQVQWRLIALLADLEVLLGVINACLPVMKPALKKLGAADFSAILLTWNSSWTVGKRSHTSRSHHNRSMSSKDKRGSELCPQIDRKGGYQMSSYGSPNDEEIALSATPRSPPQVLSKHYVRSKQWDDGSSGSRDVDRNYAITE